MAKSESSHESILAESLHDSALIQAQTSDLYTVYPANTNNKEYEFLKVSSRWPRYSRIRGNPHKIPVDELDLFAAFIDDRSLTVPAVLREDAAVTRLGTLMAGGNHVVVGNSHGDLLDVPISLVGLSGRLREMDPPVAHHTALIASKGIDYLGVHRDVLGKELASWAESNGAKFLSDGTVPARYLLSLVAHVTYFTFPATASFGSEREGKELLQHIRRFNAVSKFMIRASMKTSHKPLLLAEGITGTKIKSLDAEKYQQRLDAGVTYETFPEQFDTSSDVRVLGKISSATVDLAKGMYLLLNSSDLNAEPVRMSFSEFLYMDGQHDALDVGHELTRLEQANYPSATVVFDEKGNLPTKRD
jgi:hypothetical protein